MQVSGITGTYYYSVECMPYEEIDRSLFCHVPVLAGATKCRERSPPPGCDLLYWMSLCVPLPVGDCCSAVNETDVYTFSFLYFYISIDQCC